MQQKSALLLSTGAVLMAALAGASAGPQNPRAAIWYARLEKPPGTPPGPAIGIVWPLLEALLCFAGYRLLIRSGTSRRRGAWRVAMGGWFGTLVGLAAFPQAFFGTRLLGGSTATAAAMCAAATASTLAARRIDPQAAIAMAPTAAWTAAATLLNEELWRRNSQGE